MHSLQLGLPLLVAGGVSASWAGSTLSATLETCRALIPSNIFKPQPSTATCTDEHDSRSLFNSTLMNNTLGGTISDMLNIYEDHDSKDPVPKRSFQISDCIMSNTTGEQFCVYYDPDFNGGRGISIVGTSKLATRILNLPAYLNPEVLEWGHPTPPYTRHHFPGKGWGLVANKTLHRDDLVMNTTPFLLIDNAIPDHLPIEDSHLLGKQAVERLPKASQKMFWALAAQGDGDLVTQTINTNVFKATIRSPEDEGIDTRALLPENSFMNHDCRPNTHWVFDTETLTQYVYAIRTIQPGEELTLSYISLLQPRDVRMDILHSNWGFKCNCPACTAAPQAAALSDARVNMISELRDELSKFDSSTKQAVEKSELLISLMEQERTDVLMCEAHAHAAREHNTMGHSHSALKYAYLALESGLYFTDICSWDTEDMLAMVNRGPRSHWSWAAKLDKEEKELVGKEDDPYFTPAMRYF